MTGRPNPITAFWNANAITASWDANAQAWTRAVREGRIASRRAGTDAAILDAVAARAPARLLDLGCGEGWLCRAAAEAFGCETVGLDACEALVAAARAAHPQGEYRVADHAALAAGTTGLPGGFDAAVFNYALFDEHAAATLAGVRRLLRKGGVAIVQTLHPGSAGGGVTRRDGWRREDFAGFGEGGWSPMPWYFRSLESWRDVVREAGYMLADLREPVAEPGSPPLSLLMVCAPA